MYHNRRKQVRQQQRKLQSRFFIPSILLQCMIQKSCTLRNFWNHKFQKRNNHHNNNVVHHHQQPLLTEGEYNGNNSTTTNTFLSSTFTQQLNDEFYQSLISFCNKVPSESFSSLDVGGGNRKIYNLIKFGTYFFAWFTSSFFLYPSKPVYANHLLTTVLATPTTSGPTAII